MSQFENETNMWTIEKCISEINDIDDLTTILNILKSRRKGLARNNAVNLEKGDKVRISGSNKIEEGIVTKVNRTRAVIDVNGISWTVPFEMIRKTEA